MVDKIIMHYCKKLNKPIGNVRVASRTVPVHMATECDADCNTCDWCEEVPIHIGIVPKEMMEQEAKNRRKMGIRVDVEGPLERR